MSPFMEIPPTPPADELQMAGPGYLDYAKSTIDQSFHEKLSLPSTPYEAKLQHLWADVLRISPANLSRDDNFFSLGGDSLAAMTIVARARDGGCVIEIRDIFRRPVLKDLAASMEKASGHQYPLSDSKIPPFSLVNDRERARQEASTACNVQLDEIENVYPATAMQEGLFALTQRDPGSYLAQVGFEVPENVDLDRLKAAWEAAVQDLPIMRTRLYEASDGSIMQAIISGTIQWTTAAHKDTFLRDDRAVRMDLGLPLTRFAIVADRLLFYSTHHATYDGWSASLALQHVERLYHNPNAPSPLTSFDRYIKYVEETDEEKAAAYWRDALRQVSPPIFPENAKLYQEANIRQQIKFEKSRENAIASSTLIRSALAMVLARYSDSQDVVFGDIQSGRVAPVHGILDICGPTLSATPFRVSFEQGITVQQLLQKVQDQNFRPDSFVHWGLHKIRLVSEDAKAACDFRTLLVVQNADQDFNKKREEFLGCKPANDTPFHLFHTYPLVLQCTFVDNGYRLDLNYNSNALSPYRAEKFLGHIARVIEQLDDVSMAGASVRQIEMTTSVDHAEIRRFNEIMPQAVENCLHRLFEQTAIQRPSSTAVISHDGSFTYKQLDELASALAVQLASKGACNGAIVPLFFEKSVWAIVTMIAVMKCGAAYCPLDVKHPIDRLRQIISSLDARLIVGSASALEKLAGLACEKHEASARTCNVKHTKLKSPPISRAPTPSDLAYCLFTSGSSGLPKGVLTSHRAICTSVTQHARLGFDSTVRALQFSAYTFDISVVEIFSCLVNGGCVCMPSESQRLEDLAIFMNRWNVNGVILTPTYASLIKPTYFPMIKQLVLGGEPCRKELIQEWAGKVRLLNGYGVTEAAVCNMVAEVENPDFSENCIGNAIGSLSWVVDAENHNQLVPVGLVGELAIEGPILAEGYLLDLEKTERAFITNPGFMSTLYPDDQSRGRARRIYKTGDLVRQRANGMIEFVGRKDTQVKLRGLRIELGEIEYHSRRVLGRSVDVVAEVVTTASHPEVPIIALFVAVCQANSDLHRVESEVATIKPEENPNIVGGIPELYAAFEAALPNYMIPSSCYLLNRMPLLSSEKTDRKYLRVFASENEDGIPISPFRSGGPLLPPSTENELLLQRLWTTTLRIDGNQIGKASDFFRVGGDSLLAMRLAAAARRESMDLSVVSIFTHPTLESMALQIAPLTTMVEHSTAPFSLLTHENIGSAMLDAMEQIGVDASDIEDILPTTTVQEQLILHSSQTLGTHADHWVYPLSRVIDTQRLRGALGDLTSRASITRTRIIQTRTAGLVQVILKGELDVHQIDSPNVEAYKRSIPDFGLGKPLWRIAILGEQSWNPAAKRWLVLSAHHSVCDRWTITSAWRCVQEAYFDLPRSRILGIGGFVATLEGTKNNTSAAFWSDYLNGAPPPLYPQRLKTEYVPLTDSVYQTSISLDLPSSLNATLTTLVHAAWGLFLCSKECGSDVTFGVVSSGRNIALAGIERVLAPTTAIYPVRIRARKEATVDSFINEIVAGAISIVPHQHYGMRNIGNVSSAAGALTSLRTLLILQPGISLSGVETELGIGPQEPSTLGMYPYSLVFICSTDQNHTLSVQVAYDSHVISPAEATRTSRHFHQLLREISHRFCFDPNSKMANFDIRYSGEASDTHSRGLSNLGLSRYSAWISPTEIFEGLQHLRRITLLLLLLARNHLRVYRWDKRILMILILSLCVLCLSLRVVQTELIAVTV